ncbi:hypothetical protein VTN31DRAFT_731 [Thermomyces dupontii]|uniref:uncharacterized protein n=1 Tax=Talaromyces thermophilus TaxID=28565 RepID=UPI0037440C26
MKDVAIGLSYIAGRCFAAWMYCPIRMKSEQMMSLTVKSWLPSSKYQFDLMPLSFQDDQNPAFKGELL